MAQTDELKHRVEAKKKAIESRIAELRADTSHQAREEREGLERKLEELGSHLSQGWENVTESVAGKLNDWLHDDRR